MKRVSLVVTLALAAGLSAQAASAQTLKTVKDRGQLSCGVSQGLPGFSSPDDKGNWTGLDVDISGVEKKSGGLSADARVLLADEPTAELDSAAADRLLDPRTHVAKRYRVKVRGRLLPDEFRRLRARNSPVNTSNTTAIDLPSGEGWKPATSSGLTV